MGLDDTGMPGRLLYRRGRASAWAHHLHVVQANTVPTRNPLLRYCLRGHLDGAARCGAVKKRLAALQAV